MHNTLLTSLWGLGGIGRGSEDLLDITLREKERSLNEGAVGKDFRAKGQREKSLKKGIITAKKKKKREKED